MSKFEGYNPFDPKTVSSDEAPGVEVQKLSISPIPGVVFDIQQTSKSVEELRESIASVHAWLNGGIVPEID